MRRILPAAMLAAACVAPPASAPVPAAPAAMPRSALARYVDSAVAQPRFANAHWGVLIVDPTTGDTLAARNMSKLFMPASNQKLVTGAVALASLGADYRFRTTFSAGGPVSDGTLWGDLIVVPSGDPTFADALWRNDHRNAFRAMADSLLAHGVRRVEGGFARGASPFPDEPCGYGWELGDLGDSFAACVQDLMVNEGAMRVRRNRAPGDTATVEVAIRDPRGAFWRALRDAFVERGITMRDAIDTARVVDGAAATPLFTMASPTLGGAILAQMMKPSQNQVAEILLKTIARERTGSGTADSGRRVVERQLRDWGIDSTSVAVRDGSGVSRHDYVSPLAVMRILDAMRRASTFDVWYRALPIAGIDGTIASRMRGTAAQGNVHAKTGTVDKARSLSGYVTTADGHQLMFVFLCNNFTTPYRDVEQVQDSILVTLASRARPVR